MIHQNSTKLIRFLGFGYILLIFTLNALGEVTCTSPDQNVIFRFRESNHRLFYSISFKDQSILNFSEIKLKFKDPEFCNNLSIKQINQTKKKENYRLIVGKAAGVHDRYQETDIKLANAGTVVLIIRARIFNDGVAFRYEYPLQKNINSYELVDEHTEFNLEHNPTTFGLLLDHYKTSHEGLYTITGLDQIPVDKLIDLPVLFKRRDNVYVSITEAALRDYAGMYLQRDSISSILTSRLSPLPGDEHTVVKAILPHRSPWRVIMIADHPGAFIESNILTTLNEPCKPRDFKWLQPGKTTWTWWNGDILKDVPFTVGQNFETHKAYIDFCAAHHIEFHSIIGFNNVGWYKADGVGYDPPPPGIDLTQSIPALDIDKISAYARFKGVGLRFWVHWKPLSLQLDEAFKQFQRWNIKGLMVDFMDRDDQEMVNWIELVLRTAAKYHLHIQFHGAYKPTGLSRTFPNELTKEGALNLEVNKWAGTVDPEHNLMIPYTRMLAGPVDYHPGGFRAVTRDSFKANFIEPYVMGTRCHQLGMYVVYESYLQMVVDHPKTYENEPGLKFIEQVPTTWDETRFLQGEVGDYIAIARRKGSDWYLGAMNDWTPRSITIVTDFLSRGKIYQAEIYCDALESDNEPNKLDFSTKFVQTSEKLTFNLAQGGGLAIRITPRKR